MAKQLDTATTQDTYTALTQPGKGHLTLLTTYRRNGTGVGTPVGTVSADGKLYFMTEASTWKVKRLSANPRVSVALGTRQGKALSPQIEGKARRLYGEEMQRARALLRVGVIGRIWNIIFNLRNPGDKTAVYEIQLDR